MIQYGFEGGKHAAQMALYMKENAKNTAMLPNWPAQWIHVCKMTKSDNSGRLDGIYMTTHPSFGLDSKMNQISKHARSSNWGSPRNHADVSV